MEWRAETVLQQDRELYCSAFSSDGRFFGIGSSAFGHSANLQVLRVYPSPELLHVYHTDNQNVVAVCFHPDGSVIASALEDQSIRLWDFESEACLRTLVGHFYTVCCVSFNSNGSMLASGSEDKRVILWDSESCEEMGHLQHHRAVRSICFHKRFDISFEEDGSETTNEEEILFSGCGDGSIWVWNVDKKCLLYQIKGHTDMVENIRIHPSKEDIIVSSSADRTVRLWNWETAECLFTFEGHTSPVQSVSFRSDGKQIVSGSSDSTIRVWDMHSGICTQLLSGHHSSLVNSVECSPIDKDTFISVSEDQKIIVWKGHPIPKRFLKEKSGDEDGGMKAKTTAALDISVDEPLHEEEGDDVKEANMIGKELDEEVKVEKMKLGEEEEQIEEMSFPQEFIDNQPPLLQIGGRVICVSLTADESLIAIGLHSSMYRTQVVIIDFNGIETTNRLEHNDAKVSSLIFAQPEEQQLLVGHEDGSLLVYDLMDVGENKFLSLQHVSKISCFGWHQSEDIFLVGSLDKCVTKWNSMTWKFMGHVLALESPVHTLSMHPQMSDVFFCGCEDGCVFMSNISNSSILRKIDASSSSSLSSTSHVGGAITCLYSFLVGGSTSVLLTGSENGVLKCWDLDSLTCFRVLHGHSHAVRFMSLHPVKSRMLSSSDDGTCRIWDIAVVRDDDGEVILQCSNPLKMAILQENGKKILFITESGRVFIHPLKGFLHDDSEGGEIEMRTSASVLSSPQSFSSDTPTSHHQHRKSFDDVGSSSDSPFRQLLPHSLQSERFLGNGSIGSCYLSRLGYLKVVLKAFHDRAVIPGRLHSEIRRLSKLNHPYLMSYMGQVSLDGSVRKRALVMESMEGFSMDCILQSPFARTVGRTNIPLPLFLAFRFAKFISLGMAYLHGHRIYHFNIKPKNIFVSNDLQSVKVSDYGLHRFCHVPDLSCDSSLESIRYMHPVLRNALIRNEGSIVMWISATEEGDFLSRCPDMYSFGLLLRTMCLGKPKLLESEKAIPSASIIEKDDQKKTPPQFHPDVWMHVGHNDVDAADSDTDHGVDGSTATAKERVKDAFENEFSESAKPSCRIMHKLLHLSKRLIHECSSALISWTTFGDASFERICEEIHVLEEDGCPWNHLVSSIEDEIGFSMSLGRELFPDVVWSKELDVHVDVSSSLRDQILRYIHRMGIVHLDMIHSLRVIRAPCFVCRFEWKIVHVHQALFSGSHPPMNAFTMQYVRHQNVRSADSDEMQTLDGNGKEWSDIIALRANVHSVVERWNMNCHSGEKIVLVATRMKMNQAKLVCSDGFDVLLRRSHVPMFPCSLSFERWDDVADFTEHQHHHQTVWSSPSREREEEKEEKSVILLCWCVFGIVDLLQPNQSLETYSLQKSDLDKGLLIVFSLPSQKREEEEDQHHDHSSSSISVLHALIPDPNQLLPCAIFE